jgi:hypothetical protein
MKHCELTTFCNTGGPHPELFKIAKVAFTVSAAQVTMEYHSQILD